MNHIDVKNRNVEAELSPTEKRIRQIKLKRFLRKNDSRFIDQEDVEKHTDKKLEKEWLSSKSCRYLQSKLGQKRKNKQRKEAP